MVQQYRIHTWSRMRTIWRGYNAKQPASSRGTTGLERQGAWDACFWSWTCHLCGKQQWLTTSYKTVEGHISAMPPENLLMPADRNWRRICPTTFKDCDSDNTIARHEICNTSDFKIPDNKTEQYKQSFFVRTFADWSKLETTVVTADTTYSSAVGRVSQLVQGSSPTHRQQEQKKIWPVFNKACTITNYTYCSF